MDRYDIVQSLKVGGIIAIVRADADVDTLLETVAAVARGGVRCIEITMTSPGALECITQAAARFSPDEVLIGVGSVLDTETARHALLAGAQYLVCPVTVEAVIRMGHRYGKPVLPGAFTPTEIFQAWEYGGDLIKVFPATLGGLDYIKAIRAPMPQIPLVPTGGVDAGNLRSFFEAGAAAVGVGSNLISNKLVQARDFNGLTENARQYTEALQGYKGTL